MKSIDERLEKLEKENYFKEFKIIDGLNQHPQGLTFEQWRLKNLTNRGERCLKDNLNTA